MTAERHQKAEIIRLPIGIHGVGRKGDHVVYNPNEPIPEYRLLRFGYLDPALLPTIRERVREVEVQTQVVVS